MIQEATFQRRQEAPRVSPAADQAMAGDDTPLAKRDVRMGADDAVVGDTIDGLFASLGDSHLKPAPSGE